MFKIYLRSFPENDVLLPADIGWDVAGTEVIREYISADPEQL